MQTFLAVTTPSTQISQNISTSNEKEGSGKYKPLRRGKKSKKSKSDSSYSYFEDSKDWRMRFNNAEDPIYFVFDCLENRSLINITKDFIKDSVYMVTNLIK